MRELMRAMLREGRGRTPTVSPRMLWILLALLALAWWLQPRSPGPGSIAATGVTGHAHVIDGDSLVVGGRELRLKGIDAPEGRQHCTRNGADWACGEDARRHLQALIGGHTVICRAVESDRFHRLLAVCEVDGRTLNAAMVEDGFAVSYGNYRAEEDRARSARRGIWAGEFERPREWRDHHPRPN